MKEFFELAWSEIPDRRPSFDLIVEEILSEKYQNFFNVTDEEIDDYLNLFDYSIRNRFSVSKLLSSFRKKGDADSLFQLACMYDQGEAGLEVDKKQANDCYRQACEKTTRLRPIQKVLSMMYTEKLKSMDLNSKEKTHSNDLNSCNQILKWKSRGLTTFTFLRMTEKLMDNKKK